MLKTFLIVCFFLSCTIINSQPIDLKFNFLTTENGLSNSAARCIVQDYKGYIWIGTQSGLNKYDGISSKIYTRSVGNGNLLGSNLITDLCETRDKTLWVGTNIGINYYNRDLDKFEQIDLSKVIIQESAQPYFVACLREFDSSLFALISTSDTIYLLTKKISDSTFSVLTKVPALNKTTYFPGGITVDFDKNIWFGTYASGLYQFNSSQKSLVRHAHKKHNPETVSGDFIRDIALDNHGDIWIATYSGGASKFLFNEKKFKRYLPSLNKIGSISGDEVNRIHCSSSGEIWFGMNKTGLDYYDPIKDQFFNYTHHLKDKYSLNHYSVWSIYFDKNGGLWVATSGGGVNYWSPYKKKFKHYSFVNKSTDWLSNNIVSCFAEDKNGMIWLGTDGGGLHRFDSKKNTFKVFESNEMNQNAFFSNMIKALYCDEDNNIWTGQLRGPLEILDQKKNTIKRIEVIPNSAKGISNNMIKCIASDNKGNKWVGTDEGLNMISSSNDIKQYFSTSDPKSLSNHCIRNIFFDSKHRMWLSTLLGINLYDIETNSFFNFNNNPKGFGIFKQMSINSIVEDRFGEFWVCTSENGLFKFNDKTFVLEEVKPTPNFSDFSISALMFDKYDNLWISTNSGLYKYNSKTGDTRSFTQHEEIQVNEFIDNSAIKLSDGRMVFGGLNGFIIFNPDSIEINTNVPNIEITNLKIFNQDVLVGNKSVLKKQISECDTLILDYKKSVLTFSFRSFDYVNPTNNNYAYKLEPFDNEWNYIGRRQNATYTNLSPGEYDLIVKGSNNDGVWNEEGKSLHIIITPPYYRTLWFKALIVLIIISLIYLLYLFRTTQIRKINLFLNEKIKERTTQLEVSNKLLEENHEEIVIQKEELIIQRDLLRDLNDLLKSKQIEIMNQNLRLKEHQDQLETKIKERTSELENAKERAEESDRLKSSFLANMSHEIRTPMNAIVGFSELIIEEEVSESIKKQYHNIIRNNCDGLLELIDDIIDLSKIESQQITIKKNHIEALSLISELEANSNKIKLNSEVAINCAKNLPNIIFLSDVQRVRQVLNYFLSNAIKFTSLGEITIGYTFEKRNITFFIKDTGIGIPAEKLLLIFDRFFKYENKKKLYGGTGLGLSISKELAKLLNGSVHVESELGKGSTFYLTLNNCVLNINKVN